MSDHGDILSVLGPPSHPQELLRRVELWVLSSWFRVPCYFLCGFTGQSESKHHLRRISQDHVCVLCISSCVASSSHSASASMFSESLSSCDFLWNKPQLHICSALEHTCNTWHPSSRWCLRLWTSWYILMAKHYARVMPGRMSLQGHPMRDLPPQLTSWPSQMLCPFISFKVSTSHVSPAFTHHTDVLDTSHSCF